ncbi:MAG: endonuclease III [bacterium]
MNKEFYDKLDEMFPDPKCELNYSNSYELLIATMLSAQSLDKRVNQVTETLFKYSLEELASLELEQIESIIKPVGTYTKKAVYTKEIARSVLENYQGEVPNNREYIESLPGVGRKTANVMLSHIFNEPAIAVDTHVLRTTTILGITSSDNPVEVENILIEKIPENKLNRVGSQLVLFGRYICKAKKPDCVNCLFNDKCKHKKN